MNVNQLTRQHLAKQGFVFDNADSFNAKSQRRKDLFGFIDFVALGPGRSVAVQTTTYKHRAEPVRKIKEERRENALAWLAAGNQIVVYGWKDGEPHEVWITSRDFES